MYVDLPYIEDMREIEFPSLPVDDSETEKTTENRPTQEQLDAVDYLIDCMDMSAQPELVLIITVYLRIGVRLICLCSLFISTLSEN